MSLFHSTKEVKGNFRGEKNIYIMAHVGRNLMVNEFDQLVYEQMLTMEKLLDLQVKLEENRESQQRTEIQKDLCENEELFELQTYKVIELFQTLKSSCT
ncbi:hypothetical protein NG54_10320 [Heyndrickxia ginsengihumi]|uniref:Uncharacterized protein n=2 Tax=Heyndrickxia ginsengihumi TaxID=363870 RepID=A0A0A6VCL0_9BACI|nr:hypothetical protein NG54_10320 [Heyndrickxia ginsengihumi]MBE6184180.1 hypothetical protein [Bacillus sp. (in: firmicutes)]